MKLITVVIIINIILLVIVIFIIIGSVIIIIIIIRYYYCQYCYLLYYCQIIQVNEFTRDYVLNFFVNLFKKKILFQPFETLPK